MARKLRDIASTALLEIDEKVVCLPNATGEGAVSHSASNLDLSALVGEVERITPDNDAGNIFAIVCFTPRHVVLHSTGQRQNAPLTVNEINPPLSNSLFDADDLARPAAPLLCDNGCSGESSKKMVRGYGELKDAAPGADIEADHPAFHPATDGFFHKNDSLFHALSSPRIPEQGPAWASKAVCEINSPTKHGLISRCCSRAISQAPEPANDNDRPREAEAA